MGALGNSGDGRQFINTFKGKFTKKANSQTTGAIKRINKNNVEVWELQFNTLSDVFLQKIEKHDSQDYGFQWNIYLAHAKSDETFKLSLPYSGRMTMGLFLRLPKINLAKEMTFVMHYFEADNKTALVVHQSGEKVPVAWTKDEPGDLPELEETMRDGKDAWDSSKRMAFLEGYMDSEIHPYLMGVEAKQPVQQSDAAEIGAAQQIAPESVTATVITTGGTIQEKMRKANTVQDKTAVQQALAPQTKPADEIQWDGDAQTLKKVHTDGNYYACDEAGVFKRDKDGKMIACLPF